MIKEVPTPWLLYIVRQKEGVDFHTCFGYSAAEHLIIYLWERVRDGEVLTASTPVYSRAVYNIGRVRNGGYRITTNIIQKMMRKNVVRAGVLSAEVLKTSDINPAGYHALRSSFSKRLDFAGMPTTYIDYMQGHTLPFGGVYRRPNPQKLREKYREFEGALTVGERFKDIQMIEAHYKKEIQNLKYINEGRAKKFDDLKAEYKSIRASYEKKNADLKELETKYEVIRSILEKKGLK